MAGTMVYNVEVQSDHPMNTTSLLSVATHAENEEPPTDSSFVSVDASSRDALDTSSSSRITVNIHNSILNIAEEDEDEDYENEVINSSFLLEPVEDYESSPKRGRNESSLLDKMTEQFVDNLCFPSMARDDELRQGYQNLVQSEIVELLSCVKPPNPQELEQVWGYSSFCHDCDAALPSPPRARSPRRHSLRERALRLRRLRHERGFHSPSPVSVLLPRVTRSMDMSSSVQPPPEAAVSHCMGSKEPIPEDVELGYDSDPGEVSFSFVPKRLPKKPTLDTSNVRELVRESLNLSWNLTWHPQDKHPVSITAWVERGNLLQNNNIMLEPCLMWREAYPTLSSKKPCRIRLLNLCRIYQATDLDRSIYPLAQSHRSFVLRTSDNNREYLLEATSQQERDEILVRWKHTIARFAMLAVVEDVRAIHKEFFLPSTTVGMVHYAEADV